VRAALGFLTPFGGSRVPTRRAVAWFPAVGAAVGAGVGAMWWAGRWGWAAPVAAGLAVGADAVLTGMLHLDGLLDSADGLLAHLPRPRRLEVMADPGVGAFGFVVGVVVVLLRWGAFASLRPTVVLVAGIWCASRSWMALTMAAVPYARPGGGLASAFVTSAFMTSASTGSADRPTGLAGFAGVAGVAGRAGLGGLAGALALAAAWNPVRGPLAVLAGTSGAAGVVWLGWRKLGGYTGDVLGAAGVVGETVALLVASVRR